MLLIVYCSCSSACRIDELIGHVYASLLMTECDNHDNVSINNAHACGGVQYALTITADPMLANAQEDRAGSC